jgi:hypothetical protein
MTKQYDHILINKRVNEKEVFIVLSVTVYVASIEYTTKSQPTGS